MRTLPCHLPGVHLSELCAKKLSLVGGGALWWAHVVAVTGEARRPREGGWQGGGAARGGVVAALWEWQEGVWDVA